MGRTMMHREFNFIRCEKSKLKKRKRVIRQGQGERVSDFPMRYPARNGKAPFFKSFKQLCTSRQRLQNCFNILALGMSKLRNFNLIHLIKPFITKLQSLVKRCPAQPHDERITCFLIPRFDFVPNAIDWQTNKQSSSYYASGTIQLNLPISIFFLIAF